MRQRYVMVTVLTGLALVLLCGFAAPAGARGAHPVACGQTITTSVVLRADLACAGDGLIIAADGVTVWLAGHTISSTDGTGVGVRFGIPPTPTQSSVCVEHAAVRGGTISGFSRGVFGGYCDPHSNEVSSLRLMGNTWGVYLQNSFSLGIDHTTIVGPNGIGGPFSSGSVAGGVSLTNSRIDVTDPTGISLLSAWVPSSVSNSRLNGGRALGVADGHLFFTNSSLHGVAVDCSDANVAITGSYVVGGTVGPGSVCGYYLSGDHFIGPGSGVGASVGGYSYLATVTDTEFTGWDVGLIVNPGPATITGNTFAHNGTGLTACTTSNCSGTVSGNSFYGNLGPGLVLRSGTWHVGSNVAARNGGLGIDAQNPALTVIDDGGNVARRNLPPQCVGVACAAHP
jgi:hypothetical protein